MLSIVFYIINHKKTIALKNELDQLNAKLYKKQLIYNKRKEQFIEQEKKQHEELKNILNQ